MLVALLVIGLAFWWLGHGIDKQVKESTQNTTTYIYNDNRVENHYHYTLEVQDADRTLGDTSQREFIRRG